MKLVNIKQITLAVFTCFILSFSASATRIYQIKKSKVGGDGSGLYDRVTQGDWQHHKQDYRVGITCENPGSSPCRVQSWPPSALLPRDIVDNVLLGFADFMAANGADSENGSATSNIVHHIYDSAEGPIDIYFHCIVDQDGSMIYEMYDTN